MAHGRTKEADLQWESGAKPGRTAEPAHPVDADAGFGAEFRELARQRRFLRDGEAASPEATTTAPPADSTPAARSAGTTLSARVTSPAPRPASDEAIALATALGRASDRLVVAREELAVTKARAERAEADLTAANGRLMAAQILVQDAQRATHQSAERCAWLEGRNDSLQEALELAVNASTLTRWRWRRQMAAAKRAQSN